MADDVIVLGDATSTPANSDLVDVSAAPAESTPSAEASAEATAPAETSAPVAEDIPVQEDNPNKKYANSGVADIVFLVDVTGSMKPCIDALRDNINKFIDMLTSTEGNGSPVTDWRARVVGYRDFIADGSTSYGWLNDTVFTRDVTTLRHQLSSLTARGGGDNPESLLDAMMTVAATGSVDLQATGDEENSNKWRVPGSAARIVIVFTDATYHPTMSIPGYEGAGVRDLYNIYNQEHIKPYFFVPADASYAIFGRFKGAILTQCGEGCDGLLSVTNDQAQFQKLLEQLAKGVSQSASTQVRIAL